MTVAAPSFVPPSPGAWELEQTHLTKPPSVFIASTLPDAVMRGFREGTRAYGLLLDHLEFAVINRFIYTTPRAVGAPKGAKGPPPRPVFAIIRRVHPEIRRRVARADEVFRTRAWRADVRWWDAELKPSLLADGRALREEPLDTYSDAQLADHVRRAAAFLVRATITHHRLNFCAMLPVGDFLVHAIDWTGLPAAELLKTMRGLSPMSAGALEELEQVRRAMLADPDARAQLAAERPAADVLADLQGRGDAVGAAVRAYVDAVGLRVLGGYDVADRHAREHPELLVKIMRTVTAADPGAQRTAAEQALAGIRARVPAAHVAQFDDLLAEAQSVYRIRDERVLHGDALAVGLARRAILAAGDRLVARGRADRAEHLVDATPDEIAALLEGKPGPSSQELAERARWRVETPLSSAPARLGFDPAPPPPPEWLPPAAARMQRIVVLVMSLMFDVRTDAAKTAGTQALKGFPVSPGVYEGPARVIRNVEELPDVQRGEVLVATSTGPTFNVVLPLVGALVTERGGVLSHAAIVSREYGLPGVVGCVGATSAVRTGMRVRVDGNTGEVWTLG